MQLGALRSTPTPAGSAAPAVTPADEARLQGAAQQFESIFVSLMLREALTTEEGTGMFGKGPGSSVMQGMLEQTLADEVTRGRGLGISQRLLDSVRPLPVADES